MESVEVQVSPTTKEYYLKDGKNKVKALEYFHIVNDTYQVNAVFRIFRSTHSVKDYKSIITKLRATNPIVIKKPRRFFWDKKYTFIPILYLGNSFVFKILYYLEGSGYSRERHHYDYLTFYNELECMKYVDAKHFKPTEKLLK